MDQLVRARMTGRSWVTYVVAVALSLVQALFVLAVGRPNGGLLAHLGYRDDADFVARSGRVGEALHALLNLYAAQTVVLGAALLAVALTAYRRGERWAWWTLWLLPVSGVAQYASDVLVFGGSQFDSDSVGTGGVTFLYPVVPAVVALLLGRASLVKRG